MTTPTTEPAPAEAAPQMSAPSAQRNGLWNAASNGLNAVAGMLASVIVVRHLSTQGYGVLSYYLWLASVTGAVGTLAFPHALTKVSAELLGQGREDETRGLNDLVWWLTFTLNVLIAAALLLAWWRHPQDMYLVVVAAVQVPVALASVVSSVLWARQDYRPVAVWTSLAALLQVGLVLLAMWRDWGGPGFAVAVLGSATLTWLGLAVHLRRQAQPGRAPRVSRQLWRQYLSFLIPATLIRLIEVVVWQRSEMFFLSRMSSTEQIGYYSLAYTLYSIVLSVGWALINGYYPAISNLHGAGETQGIQRQVQQGVNLAVTYAAPVGFAAITALGLAVQVLYGDKMLPAVQVGQVLLAGLIPGVVCGMLTLTLSALGRVWYSVWLGLGVSTVNILLALWLIPRSGALGGALASTGSQVAYFFMLVTVLSRVGHIRLSWGHAAQLVGLAALSLLGLPYLLRLVLPGPDLLMVPLALLLGMGLYAGVLWRTGKWRPDHGGAVT